MVNTYYQTWRVAASEEKAFPTRENVSRRGCVGVGVGEIELKREKWREKGRSSWLRRKLWAI